MEQNRQLQTSSKIGSVSIRTEIESKLKIRHLETVEPVKQVLRYVFILIGLKPEQIPDDAEKMVLIEYITENFKNYTPEEIKIAFKMAMKGEFEVDITHYGKFSSLYLQKVFNGYLDKRNKIALEIERERLKNEQIVSEEEKQKQIEDFKKESIKIYRESDLEFNGTKFHANVLYPMLKEFFTREELVEFKKIAGKQLHRLQKEYEEKKKYGQVMVGELATVSFTQSEWKKRTALITVQEAIKRGIEI